MREPRIVLWDIETVQNLVASFTLYSRGGLFLPHRNVVRERYIVTASWKLLNEPKVHSVSVLDDPKRFKRAPHDDRYVCQKLHEMLSTADVIVAHNGDDFDIRWTEGRMLVHGLDPLPPILKVDTKKIAKSRFNLNSYRLDYLCRYLGLGQKMEIDPERWMEILRNDSKARAAIQQMVEYNKVDILLLEGLFKRLQPFMPNHVNRQLFGGAPGTCPRCGSAKVERREFHYSTTRVYPRFRCLNAACGGWFRDKSMLASAATRVL